MKGARRELQWSGDAVGGRAGLGLAVRCRLLLVVVVVVVVVVMVIGWLMVYAILSFLSVCAEMYYFLLL